MGGVVREWLERLERLQKCNIACICSVRVEVRVGEWAYMYL
jgi:hypothetical protein